MGTDYGRPLPGTIAGVMDTARSTNNLVTLAIASVLTSAPGSRFALPQWLAAAVAPQQLDLRSLLNQPGDELSVGIPGFNWMTGLITTVGVIGIIVQHEIGSVSVKDGNNFTFDVRFAEGALAMRCGPAMTMVNFTAICVG